MLADAFAELARVETPDRVATTNERLACWRLAEFVNLVYAALTAKS
jgi:hypothetical protein